MHWHRSVCHYLDTVRRREFLRCCDDCVCRRMIRRRRRDDYPCVVTYDWYCYQSLIAMSVVSGSVSWRTIGVVDFFGFRVGICRGSCKTGIRNKWWISCRVVLLRKLPVGWVLEVILIACIYDSPRDWKENGRENVIL